jgi:hypothetical protein
LKSWRKWKVLKREREYSRNISTYKLNIFRIDTQLGEFSHPTAFLRTIAKIIDLKGQCHKMVVEIRPWSDRLG